MHGTVAPITYPKLPNEPEAEQRCLGACFRLGPNVAAVRANCSPDDFQDELHRRIAAAIWSLDDARETVTPISVKAALGDDAGLDALGGFGYLVSLMEVADTAPARAARIVANTSARRAAMIAIWDAQEQLARNAGTITEILRPVVAASDRAADRSGIASGSELAADSASEFLRALDTPADDTGVPSGLRALDDILGLFLPGNLYVLAGRPGMGKSAKGASIARGAAQAGVPVEYYSLEMPRQQLAARLMADLDYDHRGDNYPLQYSRLMRRKAAPSEVLRAMEARDRLKALPITIHDRDSMTMADISGLARARAARIGKRGIIIIDHMHFIRPDDRYRGNQTQELGEIAKAAKRLARALEWPVILLAQLNRQVENRPEKERTPTLADLRQSGEIEEAADVVMFLHRPAYYVERRRPPEGQASPEWGGWLADMDPVRHVLNIDVAKHRNGETGVIRAYVEIGSNSIRDGAG